MKHQKIKFPPSELKVLEKIYKEDSICVSGMNKSENNAVKNLYFADLIERRNQVVNVYYLTIIGKTAMDWNEMFNDNNKI